MVGSQRTYSCPQFLLLQGTHLSIVPFHVNGYNIIVTILGLVANVHKFLFFGDAEVTDRCKGYFLKIAQVQL